MKGIYFKNGYYIAEEVKFEELPLNVNYLGCTYLGYNLYELKIKNKLKYYVV